MELFGDEIFIRGVQLILITFAGILFVVLGYKLFMYGVDKGRGKLRGKSEFYKIIFSGSGPGLFFMILGGLIIFFSIVPGGALLKYGNLKRDLSNIPEPISRSVPIDTVMLDAAIIDGSFLEDGRAGIPKKPSASLSRGTSKSKSKRRIKGALGLSNTIGNGSKVVYRSEEELTKVINTHNNAIQYCYKKLSKMNPTLKGDVVVEFIIDYKGQVKTAHIIRSSMYSKKIENCITSRIRGWRFKPIDQKDGDVKVRQKYLFG